MAEKKENKNRQITRKNVITGTVIGSVVGAATTLLLAPKSGKELRGDITEQVGTAKDKAVDKTKEFGDTTKVKFNDIKTGASNKSKQFTSKLKRNKKETDEDTAINEEEGSEQGAQLQSNDLEEAQGNENADEAVNEEDGKQAGDKPSSKKSEKIAPKKDSDSKATSSKSSSNKSTSTKKKTQSKSTTSTAKKPAAKKESTKSSGAKSTTEKQAAKTE